MENTVNRLILTTIAAAVTTVAVSASANAQLSSNPFQIGAFAGVAIPTGDLGDVADMGYNVTVALGYKPMLTPIGIRVEAAYNQFGLQDVDGNVNIPAFTGNLVYELPTMGFRPYVIGGAGLYRTNVDVSGAGSAGENRFGFNAGGGIKLPLSTNFETFVEARYNHVSLDNGSFSFIPITVGVMF
jgi:opacity protein-like surface antigen